jgi:hypothetical protein
VVFAAVIGGLPPLVPAGERTHRLSVECDHRGRGG